MIQKKYFIVLTGFLIYMNAFYGCAGLKKESVIKNYFDLNIKMPFSGQDSISLGASLLVKEFFIDPAFDSQSFIYRIGKNEYVNDYYNEFINYPSKLFTDKIEEALWASLYFKPALTQMKQDIDFRLSGKITRLYGDFQDTGDPLAIVEIRMILEKKTGHTFQAIRGKTYLAQEPLSSPGAGQLVAGWNRGLSKILAQFIADCRDKKDHSG